MRKFLIVIVSYFVVSSPAFGVINGKPMEELGRQAISQAILGFNVRVEGLVDDPCSASWLSRDTFITASHCFVLNDYLTTGPQICFKTPIQPDASTTPERCLSVEDYEVFLAPQIGNGSRAPTRKLKKVVTIQIPDVVLVKVKNQEFLEKEFHSVLILADPSAFLGKSPLFVIGQGCPQFPASRFALPEGLGTFRWQVLDEVLPDKEGTIISNWKEGDVHGATCWGDSGGPLLVENNSLTGLRGIVSGMKRNLDYELGKTTSSVSFYSDLWHPTTVRWLRDILN